MTEPIPLYRFLDSDGALKTLVAGRFRVGLVSRFNDPFEWRLGFRGIPTPDEKAFAENFSTDHLAWLERWMGILCFSKTAFDPTLWSLYAEKHSGAAFEIRHPWSAEHIVQMKYTDDRPVLDFDELRKTRDEDVKNKYLLSLLDGLMRRKSPSWAFEQEYRLQVDLKDNTFCELADGRHHWRIPPHALTRVVLGFRCPLEEAVVRKLLDMNGFAETNIARARMCSEAYSIKC
jgi:hypothetical protein